MRVTTVGVPGRQPPSRRLADPGAADGRARRGELAAGLATALVAGQFLVAQPTLLAAALLVVVGRLTRWRPHWLAVPVAASLVWLQVGGLAAAAAAFAVGARRLASYLLAAAIHPRLLADPGAAARGATNWLIRELPLALLIACAEAALVLWLGWWRPSARTQSRWEWRPGLLAAARRRMSAAALTAGHTVTTDGCVVGVAVETGKPAGFSWAEAANGVLLTSADTELPGLAITCAALRRRKTVVILECGGPDNGTELRGGRATAAVAGPVRDLARSLGVPVAGSPAAEVPVAEVPVADAHPAPLAGVIGRAIRRRECLVIETSGREAARQAAADVAEVLTELRDLGLRADCLAWISGITDRAVLSELLALGPQTGTVVAVSLTCTASAAPPVAAATEAGSAGAGSAGAGSAGAVIGHEIGIDALLWAADPTSRPIVLSSRRPGDFTLAVRRPTRGGSAVARTNCRAVPINLIRRSPWSPGRRWLDRGL